LKKFLFLVTADLSNGGLGVSDTILKGVYIRTILAKFDAPVSEERI
jgi:hypothetical protein